MLQDCVIDCWWVALPVTLWTWEKVVWRSSIQVCKKSSFPPNSLAPNPPEQQQEDKKEREKKGRMDVKSPQIGEGKRQSHTIPFVFAGNEEQNQTELCYAINHTEIEAPPLSSLASSFLQSRECREVQEWDRRGQRVPKPLQNIKSSQIWRENPIISFGSGSYSLPTWPPWWKPVSSLKGQRDSLNQIKHLILLKSSCERCLCIVCSFPVGNSWWQTPGSSSPMCNQELI